MLRVATEHEAMWIRFKSEQPYAIKVLFDGINVISGETAVESLTTKLHYLNLHRQQKSIQDYAFVPKQWWLNGIAVSPAKVRAFVAMPTGSGHSVEAQVTGAELTGGIQFEITPHTPYRIHATVEEFDGDFVADLDVWSSETISEFRKKLGLQNEVLTYKGINCKDGECALALVVKRSKTGERAWFKVSPISKRSDGFFKRARSVSIVISDSLGPFDMAVSPFDSVDDLKFLIEESHHIPVDQQLLTFRGIKDEAIRGSTTLGSLDVQKGSEIILHRGKMTVLVKFVTGELIAVSVTPQTTIFKLKCLIEGKAGIPPVLQRLSLIGIQIENQRTMQYYKIMQGTIFYLNFGGREMNIDEDVYIDQRIVKDPGSTEWDATQTKVFNVQILNSAEFKHVTGEEPPEPPEHLDSYLPYFKEPSEIAGEF